MLFRHGRVVRCLVRPGVTVPLAAARINRTNQFRTRKILRLAKCQVFEKVRNACLAGNLVTCANPVDHLHTNYRKVRVLQQNDGQTVVKLLNCCACEVQLCACIDADQRSGYPNNTA